MSWAFGFRGRAIGEVAKTATDNGKAWAKLPEWCEALNRDFRYQLTSIGGYAPVDIAENHAAAAGKDPNLRRASSIAFPPRFIPPNLRAAAATQVFSETKSKTVLKLVPHKGKPEARRLEAFSFSSRQKGQASHCFLSLRLLKTGACR
ncbi:MAG: hypothetical protein ACUVRY_06660 [Thermoanaerobaculaceae bacterium]